MDFSFLEEERLDTADAVRGGATATADAIRPGVGLTTSCATAVFFTAGAGAALGEADACFGAAVLVTGAAAFLGAGLTALAGAFVATFFTTAFVAAFFAGAAGFATFATGFAAGLGRATGTAFFAGACLATTFFTTAFAALTGFAGALPATGLTVLTAFFAAFATGRADVFDAGLTLFPPEAAAWPFFASPALAPPFPAVALATTELRAVFAISFTLVAVAAGCYSPDVLPQQPIFWNTYKP
ncbi:hypothetical protein [Luteibacter rhizovicinus]|uniref:hypothetical protein n=1 Tax=Luteibacter rhizovicinus TaxID=242606 RepID=UPI001051C174|nr:hypothetical protein [Luteibacter rhizovicinus]